MSKGAIDSYTFNNVSEDQTIFAAFSEVWTDPCLVTHLPYLQDFNASMFIPNCWGTQVNTGFTDNTGTSATFSRTIHALAGQLFIRLSQDVDSGMLTVNDLPGRELQRLDVQNLRSGDELPINLGDLPHGIYLVRLVTATGTATGMVSKQ